jgi:hypothetical protein
VRLIAVHASTVAIFRPSIMYMRIEYSGTSAHEFNSFLEAVRNPKMFVNRKYLIIYKKPQKTIKFKRRHGEFEQGCVLSESYTATDALQPILPACRQPLLPACVFVIRYTVRHPRRFWFGKSVLEQICS